MSGVGKTRLLESLVRRLNTLLGEPWSIPAVMLGRPDRAASGLLVEGVLDPPSDRARRARFLATRSTRTRVRRSCAGEHAVRRLARLRRPISNPFCLQPRSVVCACW